MRYPFHLTAQVLFFLIVFALSKKKSPDFSFIRIWGLWLTLTLIQLGYLVSFSHDMQNDPQHLEQSEGLKKNTYIATLVSPAKMTKKSMSATLEIHSVSDSIINQRRVSGKIISYFQLDTFATKLEYGDQIIFNAQINKFDLPLNPEAFDVGKFYSSKNIYHQVYIPSGNWEKIRESQGNFLYELIYKFRQHLLKVLKQHLFTPNEYAVASALILGSKDKLSSEIRNAYAETGAMHVLAVSGLHIGILMFMLNFILGLKSNSGKWWKKIKLIILLSILWSFALLTGASASVLRAATMFSFIIIGQAVDRKTNIYNSLGASAFILLLINPLLLYDIGFQLSYVALGGIIYLHPKIYKLWYIENKIGHWIWSGVALSVSAQIAVLPLGLYYFNQFPVFFWLSGVVVTAVAGIILGLGLFLLLFNGIPVLGTLLGYLLYASIWFMNSLIFMIQKLPGAVWEGFWLEPWQVFSWYFVLISSLVFLRKRKLKCAYLPLMTIILLFCHRVYLNYYQQNQSYLCIYHCRKNTLFSCIYGKKAITFANADIIDSPQLSYSQQRHLWSLGVSENRVYNLEDSVSNRTLSYKDMKGQIKGKRIFLYTGDDVYKKAYIPLEIDYVLIMGNPKLKSIKQISELCNYKKIIFDHSNSLWKRKKWKEECGALGIDFIDITKEGAFITDI